MAEQNKVILSLGSKFKPDNGGNSKRATVMLEYYEELGYEIVVCTPTKNDVNDIYDKEYNSNSKIKVIRFKSVKDIIKNTKRLIKEYNVGIVLTHLDILWIYCVFFVNNAQIIHEVHTLSISKSRIRQMIKEFGYKIARKKTKAIFVLSNNAKNYFVEKFNYEAEKIHFTPNGLENFEVVQDFVFGNENKFTYIYGGTLYDWQGVNIILEHAEEILKISQDIIIKIVGDGPLYNSVNQFILSNNLQKRIIVTGFLDQEQYNDEMKKADVILIPRPSTLETNTAIPLKIFDAIAFNKPIVMSDAKGLLEVLTEKEALIFSSSNTSEFTEACKKIYRNEELAKQLTNAARIRVKDWPTNLEVAKKQLQIIENI